MPKRNNKYTILIGVAGFTVILDQITKAVILKFVPLFDSRVIIPGLFNITHIHNPGGAFGFMATQAPAYRHFLFLGISLLALCLIFYFYIKTPEKQHFLSVGFALIFGGALGKMIDRIRFGKVVDFLDIYLGNQHWPAFNVADSAISVGVAIFIYHLLFKKIPE